MNIPAGQPSGLPPHAVASLNIIFEQWPQIKRVVLYGSRAMGHYRTGSDIDLCVEGEELELAEVGRLRRTELSQHFIRQCLTSEGRLPEDLVATSSEVKGCDA